MRNNSVRNAIIYTRVSTDEQAEHGFSLAHQKESLEKYCEFHKIKIVKHYKEDASGKDFNRPAFKELFDFLKKNKNEVDALIFTRWDRFSRSTMETLKMVHELKKLDVKLVSTEQAIDDSNPEHKLMLTIYNAIAEIERDKISIRTKEGMRRAQKEGYFVNKPPISYRRIKINGDKPSLEPDKNGLLIYQIFEEYSQGIHTVEDIRTKYWKKGIKRSYQGMQDLLSNITYNGKIRIPAWKDDEEVIVRGYHEAIIPDELFEKVQRVLFGKKWKVDRSVNRDENFPLRGHIKCPDCGKPVTGSKARSRSGKIYYYYHCQDNCKVRFRVEEAELKLKEYLKSLVIKPEVKLAYKATMEQVFIEKEGKRSVEMNSIKKKIDRIRELKNSMEDKFFNDKIDAETYKRANERYDAEIKSLQVELDGLKDAEEGYMKNLNDSLALLENLDTRFEISSWEEKQKLLKILFPEKLIFKDMEFINSSKDGINLLVERVREFEKSGSLIKSEYN